MTIEVDGMVVLERAIAMALKIHTGQKDKADNPYILHPLEVMQNVMHLGTSYATVGVLHDAIEDRDESLSASKALDTIRREVGLYSEEEAALVAITKGFFSKHESRKQYLKRVAENEIAFQVKIRDLHHNQDLSRFGDDVHDYHVLGRALYLEEEAFLITHRVRFEQQNAE